MKSKSTGPVVPVDFDQNPLLSPDVSSLENFPMRKPIRGEAERQLLRQVLKDALLCFFWIVSNGRHSREKLAREAGEWIFDQKVQPFSFAYMCEHVGVEPASIRWLLRRWEEGKQGECEFLLFCRNTAPLEFDHADLKKIQKAWRESTIRRAA